MREKGLKVAIYIYKAYNNQVFYIEIDSNVNINIAGLNKCENGG